jgi:hypothetical protein
MWSRGEEDEEEKGIEIVELCFLSHCLIYVIVAEVAVSVI